MKAGSRQEIRWFGCILAALFMVCGLSACGRSRTLFVQGYVEGEYTYISSARAGILRQRPAQRGMQIKAGELLFALENTVEQAARDEAGQRLEQARAVLEDLKKGKRRSEIEALEAQVRQAQAAMTLAGKELARAEKLVDTSVLAKQELDRSRAAWAESLDRVTQLQAELKTARLGSRDDQILAAEAGARSAEALLKKAEWDLEQTRQSAAGDSLVFDVFFREGEWIPAGRPVVSLLSPENIKIRAFVPESEISRLQTGQIAQVHMDGRGSALFGKVSFISPAAEYAPPVIFSRQVRSKLVFMIEIVLDKETARTLHPGQPVDVVIETPPPPAQDKAQTAPLPVCDPERFW